MGIIIVAIIICLSLFMCGMGWNMEFHKPYADVYADRLNKSIKILDRIK